MSTPRSARKISVGTPSSVSSSVSGGGRRNVSTPSSVAFGTPASVRYSVLGGQGCGFDVHNVLTRWCDCGWWCCDLGYGREREWGWKRLILSDQLQIRSLIRTPTILKALELRRTWGRNLNVDMQHEIFLQNAWFRRHVRCILKRWFLWWIWLCQVHDTYIMTRDSILGEDDEEEKKQDDEEDEDEQVSRRIMVRPIFTSRPRCVIWILKISISLKPWYDHSILEHHPHLKHAFFRCSICQNETDVRWIGNYRRARGMWAM